MSLHTTPPTQYKLASYHTPPNDLHYTHSRLEVTIVEATISSQISRELITSDFVNQKGECEEKESLKMSKNPHRVIIGVDFGLTASGVAYWIGGQESTINAISAIRDWPGSKVPACYPPTGKQPVEPTKLNYNKLKGQLQRLTKTSQSNENKVPTEIAYDPTDNNKRVWGFHCSNKGFHGDVHKYFKLYLDEYTRDVTYRAHMSEPPSIPEVKRWIRDFMTELLKHSKEKLETDVLKHSDLKTVKYEYHFSVPTTWSMVPKETFAQTIKEAMEGLCQTEAIKICLSEAEAAAIYTAVKYPGRLEVGDTFIVCDAGGGTTDISAMEVVDIKKTKDGDFPIFRPAIGIGPGIPIPPRGESIGSHQIDQRFESIVNDYLKNHPVRQYLPEGFSAEHITGSEVFQVTKHKFRKVSDLEFFRIDLLDMSEAISYPEPSEDGLTIEKGNIQVPYTLIQKLFDEQVASLEKVITEEINKLKKKAGREVPLILCGGLGSSEYVQYRLNRLPDIQLLKIEDPILAVCKGLVLSRMLNVQHSVDLLTNRVSHHSYGVLYKEPFDGNRHDKKDCVKGADGNFYLTDQVFWLIKEGDELSRSSKSMYPFFRMTDYNNPQGKWTDRVVLSTKEKGYIVLGDVETNLQPHSLEPGVAGVTTEFRINWKSWKLWDNWNRYKKIPYKIRPVIHNDEGIRIETWFSDNETGCGDFQLSSARIMEGKDVVDLPMLGN
ncbi:hypothetical protein Egran_00627 [Elaphomyces granulatus]|uniref:Actin-like ATPase domain-containing protein n=1 Tax=Elaphomyces granulatus TaxID=519963 RepID=A0A232M5I8_9EURO|nr:hypothetical protein Egran_00627 [Elaphomyces granulatus]